MKTKLTIALFALLLCGCFGKGTRTPVSGAKDDFQVTFLFEKDGVKVYRFADGSYYHYFTTRGETITTRYHGKTLKDENIPAEGK